MNVYQCVTCGGTFTADNDTQAEDNQTQHREDNAREHLNQMTFPPVKL